MTTPTTTHPGQWRLAEVQLANWGTFHDRIYRIPVSRKGHLITGPSGSGKSSLLDAIAAVLTPDVWLRFNLAAQGAAPRSEQRTILSYIRGAWSKTTDAVDERVVSAYLRPRATWSGIILRFENEVDPPVSLCRLFVAKGVGTEWSDLCMLDRSAVELVELQQFASAGIETRKVQARWPDAVVTTSGGHARFYARMRSLFGIDQENALQLLHKTQSAKSLDSLDQLFRDFMLDAPVTFEIADNAVTQFGELRDAHDHVVQLRLQRDHLRRLEEASGRFDVATADAARARALSDAVIPFQRHETLRLSRQEHADLVESLVGLRHNARDAEAVYRAADDALSIALSRQQRLGGDTAQLQQRIETARQAEAATAARLEQYQRQLAGAGIDSAPTSAREFAELMTAIDREIEAGRDAARPTLEQNDRLLIARRTRDALRDEIDTLRRTGSAVPRALLDIRDRIARELRLPSEALPFSAELVEVVPEFADWTGAIERVLRPFALTLLVRAERSRDVRRWVDSHHLGTRLRFEEIPAHVRKPEPATSDRSLVHRVRVSTGPFADWVQAQLASRFDVACVDSPDEFDAFERAVTVNGQVKLARARYEKDDRADVGDRATWVLGDTDAKIDELLARLRAAEAELVAAQAVVDRVMLESARSQQRLGTLRAVRESDWHSIDREAARHELGVLTAQLIELTRDDDELRDAVAEVDAARAARTAADDARQSSSVALARATDRHAEVESAIADLEARFAAGEVPELDDDIALELDRRFRVVQRAITRSSIAEVAQDVTRTLQREADRATTIAQSAANDITRLATEFRKEWPTASADLTTELEDRHGYLELLSDILARGLPDHESTFLRLLQEKSRDLIGDLVSEILRAPRAVDDRILPVNTSLRRSRFDNDRFLRIRVRKRHSETVTTFISDLRSISEGRWGDVDLDDAERRFAILSEIMRKLASSESAHRSWRQQCLDTRLHVTFLADEIDESGVVRATYDSGAAMSGGQQQKLVIFCLAAALRYQLADRDEAVPRYGTIVLDEAFDKADTFYTRMALDVFVEFGFHLVLATPQKLLQTIEPYIGGATSVENPTRDRSTIANVPWDEAAG